LADKIFYKKETMTGKEKTGNNKNEAEQAIKKSSTRIRFGLRIKFSLAIIALVSIIIMTISGYFILRETDLLKEQVFSFVKREILHLSNTARETIDLDELTLIATVEELKQIKFVRYAFILRLDGTIIQYFDNRSKYKIGAKFNDGVKRAKDEGIKTGVIHITDYADLIGKKGRIYDFSRGIYNKPPNEKKIGIAIIGISDSIIRDEVASAIKVIMLISLGILGISIIASIILASVTVKPIKILSKGAAIIGKGDLDYLIEIDTTDELGQLANEFNTMTSMIKDAKEKEIESRVMEEQLEVAKEIQEGLNPIAFYEKGGIEIKGFTRAAKGVGGDYFDYIDIDEYRIGALISDVSGKGVPASLVMVMIKTVFMSSISMKDIDCASVVRAINDSLSAGMAIDKFATLFFMIYDRRTEELSFANAGHGPLLCYRKSLHSCTATKLDGVPIGIMDDVEYKQAKVKLFPGDMIVLYTDGVSEMRNAEKEEFGAERVYQLMMENNEMNANDFVELLVDEVDTFKGDVPPHDDETMLVFKRTS